MDECQWDEKKRVENLRKHGIDISQLHELFEAPFFAREDTRKDYGEVRWRALGYFADK